jgi:hypothetical protein
MAQIFGGSQKIFIFFLTPVLNRLRWASGIPGGSGAAVSDQRSLAVYPVFGRFVKAPKKVSKDFDNAGLRASPALPYI